MLEPDTNSQAADPGSFAPQAAANAQNSAYAVVINGERLTLEDPMPDGRQLLVLAGLIPADNHVLIQLVKHGSRSIGLDETVDLKLAGIEAFRAFESDRLFRFTVDGRGYEWGAGSISEADLRDIAGINENQVLLFERESSEDDILDSNDIVSLSDAGTERLHTKGRLIKVSIDGVEKSIARGIYTTEQLISLLGVQPGYLLNVINSQGQLETLKLGEKLRVKEGMKFFSQVPCGGSS